MARLSGVPASAPRGRALDGPKLAQRLRLTRSKVYLDAIQQLDAGTHHEDREALARIIDAITAEFADLTVDQRPMGIVAECFLGPPFEVHVCDVAGGILEHYRRWSAMPQPFERARALALHPAYAFIEIYPDSLRAVAESGAVSVIG